MAQLLDLPDEILTIIASYLDSFSRIHLSKSCQRLTNFFIDNSITKYTSFAFHYGKDVNYDDFKKHIKNNCRHITYLDLSYSHWNKDLLSWIIINLPNLRHLNVVGTDLDLSNISYILENNKSIDSVSTSYKPCSYLDVENLKYIHFVIDSQDMFDYIFMTKTFVEGLKLTAVLVDLQFLKMLQSLTHIHEITVRLKNPLHIPDFNLNLLSENFYVAIETITGIFISPEILNEFVSFNNLITCKSINDLDNESAVSLYFCTKKSNEKMDKFKDQIKNNIAKRSSLNIALYGPKYCPKAHFDIVQYLTNLDNVQRLSLQPCTLATRVQPRSHSNALFKPKRVSRIHSNTQETSVIQQISSTNKNIEMLQIIEKFNHHCECDIITTEWMLNSTYLESITFLRKLKYLTLSNVPYLSIKALKIIFEKCPHLEQISITALLKDIGTIQNISKIINICKNIRTFHLDAPVSDINCFLDSFESNTLTSIHITYYDEDYRVVGDELLNILMQMPFHCIHLKYLTVYNDCKLPENQLKALSRVEKHVNKNNNGMVLNLKTPKNLLMNSINDIGEFV